MPLPPDVAKGTSFFPARSQLSKKVLMMVGATYHHTGNPKNTVSYPERSVLPERAGRDAGSCISRLLRLAFRSSVGLAALALFSQVGHLIGVRLGVNLVNALVLGLLGVPGFGLLLMLQWALR